MDSPPQLCTDITSQFPAFSSDTLHSFELLTDDERALVQRVRSCMVSAKRMAQRMPE